MPLTIFNLFKRKKKKFKESVKKTQTLSLQGKYHESEILCLELLKIQPTNASLLMILGYNYKQTNKHQEAISFFKRAINLSPKSHYSYLFLSQSYNALDDKNSALIAIKKAFEILPNEEYCISYLRLINTLFGANEVKKIYEKNIPNNLKEIDAVQELYIKILFEAGLHETAKFNNELGIYTLISAEDYTKRKRTKLCFLESTEKIPFISPQFYDEKKNTQIEQIHYTESNKPYVGELENVKIFSKSGFIITEDNFAINDLAVHPDFGKYVSFIYDKTFRSVNEEKILIQHKNYEINECEKGIFLCGLATEYYGHWVPEFLTKMQYYEQHPNYSEYPIIVDENMPQSHFEYLSSISKNPIIKIPPNTGLRVKKLLVAPTPTFYPVELVENHKIDQKDIGPLSPNSLRYLQTKINSLEKRPNQFGSKIYLSRKNMSWRKIINEDELITALKEKEYTPIDVENLSFEAQINLFANAKSIVAPNGSALLNIIFSDVQTNIFVLSQKNLHNWGGFYGPMKEIGYKNITFITNENGQQEKHSNYEIPTSKIIQAINEFEN